MAAPMVTFFRSGLKLNNLIRNSYFHGQRLAGIRLMRTSSVLQVSAEFDAARERVTVLKEEPDNMVKLQLYALYKQATLGKCDTEKPGAFNFVAKAKWSAWNELGDLSQEDAEKKYIVKVEELETAEKS